MRHPSTLALCALLLAGCGGIAPDRAVDPGKLAAAQTAYRDCLNSAAQRYDDVHISASEAVQRVTAACAAQWTTVVDLGASDDIGTVFHDDRAAMRAQGEAEAAVALNAERKANRFPGY